MFGVPESQEMCIHHRHEEALASETDTKRTKPQSLRQCQRPQTTATARVGVQREPRIFVCTAHVLLPLHPCKLTQVELIKLSKSVNRP